MERARQTVASWQQQQQNKQHQQQRPHLKTVRRNGSLIEGVPPISRYAQLR
jgi:hypothetical protein